MAFPQGLRRWPRVRSQRAGLAVALLSLVVYLFVFESDPAAHRPGADGFYSWIVARSVAYDLDLDYANDYALCGDPWKNGIDRGGGRLDDPFYVGPAVYWVPALWVARAVVPVPRHAKAPVVGACSGPRTSFVLHLAPILGAVSVWLFYRIARRVSPRDGPAALSAALFGLASSLLAYASVLPSYSHVYATFAVTCLVVATLRAWEAGLSPGRWALVGLALTVCILQRSSCVVHAFFPAVLALLAAREAGQARGAQGARAGVVARLAPLGLVGGGALVGGGLLLAYYRLLYGSVWTQPQGANYVHLGHAHPWLLLLGVHGGLFYTAPATWIAVVGAVQLVRDRRTRVLALAALVPCALEIYVSSLPLDWDGACSFGARRLTTLLPFFALFAARPIERLRAWLTLRPARAGVAVGVTAALPLVFSTLGAVWGLPRGRVTLCDTPTQAELYGGGATVAWSLLDEVGDVAVLPMALAFRLRYGLPMSALQAATQARYVRHYRDLTWVARDLDLRDRSFATLGRGLDFGREGARLVKRRASLVFAAQWPFATKTTLRVKATRAVRLGVAMRSWTGRTVRYGSVVLEPGTREVELAVPEDGFDSGLQEMVFEVGNGDGDAEVVIERISFDDETPRVPIRGR